MVALRVLLARLLGNATKTRVERHLRAEIEAHLDLLSRDFEDQGMSPRDARRAARRAFGSVDAVTEAHRDQQRFRVVEWVVQDARHAVRHLAGAPWFTTSVVAALSAGMGVAVLVFAILNAMVLRPAPFARADELFVITTRDARGRDRGVSYPDYLDWRAGLTSFTSVAAFAGAAMNVSIDGRPSERMPGAYVAAHTFALLGERPFLGRSFSAEDDRPGAPSTVVLSHAVWQAEFGAARDVVGTAVRVNGRQATVVGVMAPGFSFPLTATLWQPLGQLAGVTEDGRDARRLSTVARLAPGVAAASAALEVVSFGTTLDATQTASTRDVHPVAVGFQERFLGRVDQGPPVLLVAAAALLLLIACATAGGLLASRASFRAPEIALRSALGASRARLLGQLVIESLLLAAMAAGVSLIVASVGLGVFEAQTVDLGLPPWTRFTMDRSVVAAAVLLTIVVTLLFGVAPIWRLSGVADPRRPDGASRASRTTALLARPLVSCQIALSVLLLAGTWTIVRYSAQLAASDDVIDAPAITVGRVALDPVSYPTADRRAAYFDALRARLKGHRELIGATIATAPPFAFADVRPLTIEGVATDDAEPVFVVGVDRDYFTTVGVPVVRGRGLRAEDEQPRARAVVVNERFAARYLAGADPMTRRVRLGANRNGDPDTDWLTIVGVSASVRQAPIQDLQPVVYVPLPSERRSEVFVLARARPGLAAGPALRSATAAVDGTVPLYGVMALDHISRMSRWTPRTFGAGLSVVGVVALVLSTFGAYAVAAYAASRRTKEIGLRVALGASAWDVVRVLLTSSAATVAAGLALGIAATAALTRVLAALLAQAGEGSAAAVVLVPALATAGVSLAAVLIPAVRATTVDPVLVLRRD